MANYFREIMSSKLLNLSLKELKKADFNINYVKKNQQLYTFCFYPSKGRVRHFI
jgi:hypothetical protein